MGKFALGYSDQAEGDHAVLKAAVRKGDIEVELENEAASRYRQPPGAPRYGLPPVKMKLTPSVRSNLKVST